MKLHEVWSLAILKGPATKSLPGSDNTNKLSPVILTCTAWGDDGGANTKQCMLNLPTHIKRYDSRCEKPTQLLSTYSKTNAANTIQVSTVTLWKWRDYRESNEEKGRGSREGGREGGCSQCIAGWDALSRTEAGRNTLFPSNTGRDISQPRTEAQGTWCLFWTGNVQKLN